MGAMSMKWAGMIEEHEMGMPTREGECDTYTLTWGIPDDASRHIV